MVEIWSYKLIAKTSVYFISDIHVYAQEINIVYKQSNNEGCAQNLLHTDTFSILLEDESQLCIYWLQNWDNIFICKFVV
jgi:hypothetical protein